MKNLKHVFYLLLKNQLPNVITRKSIMKTVETVCVQPIFLMILDSDVSNVNILLSGVKVQSNASIALMEPFTTTSTTNVWNVLFLHLLRKMVFVLLVLSQLTITQMMKFA